MIITAILAALTIMFLSCAGVVAIVRSLFPCSPSLTIATWWRGVLVVTMQPLPARPGW